MWGNPDVGVRFMRACLRFARPPCRDKQTKLCHRTRDKLLAKAELFRVKRMLLSVLV